MISPVLFSLYVNDIHSPSHPVELDIYANDTAISHVPQADAARQLPGVIPQ